MTNCPKCGMDLAPYGFARDGHAETLLKRIEELTEGASVLERSEQAMTTRIEELERQLLAIREALRQMSPLAESERVNQKEALNSTPADIARKYSKREVLEKLKQYAAHMPSCRVSNPIYCSCGLVEALTLARKELETK